MLCGNVHMPPLGWVGQFLILVPCVAHDSGGHMAVMQGTAGEPLAPGQLAAALQGHEMFLYFGHGSGDQYLSARYAPS